MTNIFNFDRDITIKVAIDLVAFCLIIIPAFNGYRRGVLRSIFSLIALLAAFMLTNMFYERLSLLLQTLANISTPPAKVISFSTIFVGSSFILQVINLLLVGLLGQFDTRGNISRMFGALFSAIKGVIFVSIIIMIIAFYPVERHIKESISFRVLKDIAPTIAEYSRQGVLHR